jgi:DNA-binding NarL/FixJ family response regulator
MAASGSSSDGMPVVLCAKMDSLGEQASDALTAGGHPVLVRTPNVERLLASCNGNLPACLVVAADRPDRSTMDLVRMVRANLGAIPAVLACRQAPAAEVRRALQLGVDGIVLEEDVSAALAGVVAVVCTGQVSVPTEQRKVVRARALTTRERQILTLVVEGLTNSQIAAELYLAESTIKSHLSSAFGKLGVSSRGEAAAVILDPERGRGLGIGNVQADFVGRVSSN